VNFQVLQKIMASNTHIMGCTSTGGSSGSPIQPLSLLIWLHLLTNKFF